MMSTSQPEKSRTAYAWIAATVTWFALILQFILSISMSLTRGQGALHGVSMYFAFFTVLTNLLCAIALSLPLLAPGSQAGRFFAQADTITGIAANIVLVGISYNLLLRNVWHPQGLQLLGDILLHDVNPLLFVGYWWLFAAGRRVDYHVGVRWAVYPIIYFVYALVRGGLTRLWAYPFIDVDTLGFPLVLVNSLAILLGFLIIAAILVALGRFKKGSPSLDRA